MTWHIVSLMPELRVSIEDFPFYVGRIAGPTPNCAIIDDPVVSRRQFLLQRRLSGIWYVNNSETNPGELDGEIVDSKKLTSDSVHVLRVDDIVMAIGTDENLTYEAAVKNTQELYFVTHDGKEIGPLTGEQLLEGCGKGYFQQTTAVRSTYNPGTVRQMSDIVDFAGSNPPQQEIPVQTRSVTSEEVMPELGESFKCPYCRTVSNLADVLSVSVSPRLLGDPVLGDGEQKRFLPSQFNGNGLALDSDGGVCTEIACPRCHMSLPRMLLDTPQSVMSVIGAAGAGKSVFLASCVWNCRQQLLRRFGISFTDLAPAWNTWIRAYEERLFFQQDDHELQQIEKTDLQGSNVSRSILLDGDNVLVPMPCFFKTTRKDDPDNRLRSFVLYDCAGEHFRPGADVHSSLVTLNMLGADVLFFLFDPSADPRFRPYLDLGGGTAGNYAQMQDTLLSEVAAKIAKYHGNNAERKLQRPLLFGISKCDLLKQHLTLDAKPYAKTGKGCFALDIAELRRISDATERFLDSLAPEVAATAHDIAENVWFLPVSALGHNPMREGVRPCDIKPIWVELPVVFTLAKQGLVPTVNGEI